MSRAAAERLEKLSQELAHYAAQMREAEALSHGDAAADWSASILIESKAQREARQACHDYLEDTAEGSNIPGTVWRDRWRM
jgi:hypothetical protein